MGYSAVKGGLEAIWAAEELVRRKRQEGESAPLETDQLTERLRLAVDRVQGEAGLWAPELAARAIRQTEGDLIEASLLVRAYRSTVPRFAYSPAVSPRDMAVQRRIVPAFSQPPGPQLLGRTLDYTERLIDFGDASQAEREADAALAGTLQDSVETGNGYARDGVGPMPERLLDLMRRRDLVVDRTNPDDPEPFDISRGSLRVPAPRSGRLATLARGETGALVNLWYEGIRGNRQSGEDITLGEVRTGRLPVSAVNPITGNQVTIGHVGVTEIEAFTNLNKATEDTSRFDVGYGLVLGHNERKAIAMAILDVAIERDHGATGLEQHVLLTCDGLDASGFLEHLKLPHYVTFASQLDRKLAQRRSA
ncbi:MAG: carbon-phosphorus lyase complex subunit PhnI [Chloroflexi bacterium]|nr:carbon-phosphorus lyase complex subunit PhnI [Chloroflexota bacterium]